MKLQTLSYPNPLSAILEDFFSIRFKAHQEVPLLLWLILLLKKTSIFDENENEMLTIFEATVHLVIQILIKRTKNVTFKKKLWFYLSLLRLDFIFSHFIQWLFEKKPLSFIVNGLFYVLAINFFLYSRRFSILHSCEALKYFYDILKYFYHVSIKLVS